MSKLCAKGKQFNCQDIGEEGEAFYLKDLDEVTCLSCVIKMKKSLFETYKAIPIEALIKWDQELSKLLVRAFDLDRFDKDFKEMVK